MDLFAEAAGHSRSYDVDGWEIARCLVDGRRTQRKDLIESGVDVAPPSEKEKDSSEMVEEHLKSRVRKHTWTGHKCK